MPAFRSKYGASRLWILFCSFFSKSHWKDTIKLPYNSKMIKHTRSLPLWSQHWSVNLKIKYKVSEAFGSYLCAIFEFWRKKYYDMKYCKQHVYCKLEVRLRLRQRSNHTLHHPHPQKKKETHCSYRLSSLVSIVLRSYERKPKMHYLSKLSKYCSLLISFFHPSPHYTS